LIFVTFLICAIVFFSSLSFSFALQVSGGYAFGVGVPLSAGRGVCLPSWVSVRFRSRLLVKPCQAAFGFRAFPRFLGLFRLCVLHNTFNSVLCAD
jgi:hypothetical protein